MGLSSKILSAVIACIYFTTQVALGAVAESNVWAARKRPLYAGLLPVASSLPGLSSSALRSPSIKIALPEGANSYLLPIVKALPQNFGSIRKVVSSNKKSGRLVIHIQDVHRNAEAQSNIGRT